MTAIRKTAFHIAISTAALTFIWTAAVWAQSQKSTERARKAPDAHSGVKYQPLQIKPGLWERTVTYKVAGDLPISSGMLDSLTPEQRARFQARMDASSGGNTKTSTEKTCITREQVEKPGNFSDKQCTWTILESTGTRASAKLSCSASGMTMAGTGDFQAPDQEHMNGTAHMTSVVGGKKMTTDATFTSKWLQSNCENVQ